MNQPKTAGMSITLTRVFLALAAGLVIWTSAAAAQEKLGDLVEEAGFNWMIGRWTATTDDGQEIEMLYRAICVVWNCLWFRVVTKTSNCIYPAVLL